MVSEFVVHQAAMEWGKVTGCCGLTLEQLERPFMLVTDPTIVTCRGRGREFLTTAQTLGAKPAGFSSDDPPNPKNARSQPYG